MGAFKKLLKPRVISWAAISLVLGAIVIAANVVATNVVPSLLDQVLGGKRPIIAEGDSGIPFEQDFATKKEALEFGNQVTEEICEEGMVLLKNEGNALPLKANAKVSVFGKNSVNLVYGGSGSAAPGDGERKTIFDSLEDAGISYNPQLKSFYESSASGSGRSSNPAMEHGEGIPTLKTGETPYSSYTDAIKSSYDEYGDAAIVVFSRIAGENWDLPREAADDALEEAIRNATLTFDDTTSIDFTKTTGNVVTADVKLQGGDNIIKLGEGLYATVSLSYDGARNTIKLVTSNGEQEAIQLNNVGSLIDGMEYDAVNRALVIKYHDAAGNPLQVSFPVNQLFNDWEVDNPSEKSAVELTKTSPSEPDDPDKLKARVLITDDHDGDGKPDQGSNNLIEIRNNGLYVDGSAFSAATASTECVEQELTAVERAVFGNQEIGVCGEGFVYQAPNGSTYINNATNINNATYILDQSIKDLSAYTENVDNKVDIVSANTDCNKKELKTVENDILGMPLLNECGEGDTYRPNEGTNYIYSGTSFNNVDIILDREIKKTNDNVDILNQKVDIISGDVECVESTVNALGKIAFGSSYTIPECGEGAQYPVASNGCIISGASSLYEADLLLDQAFCSMMDNWFLLGWDTSTNHTYIVEEGQNRYMAVDSRLSHGNHNGMSDEELVLVTNDGPYIDPTRTEFTDTNALRIVNITDGPDHTILPANNPYNGLYLSNVWDCGLYYSETEDVDAIAAAEAAGYNTNYKTDESSSAQNYNYMNNVRQGDI